MAVVCGADDGLGAVVGSGEAFATGLCEQASAVIARPALPANWSSWRRLTKFGLSWEWPGERPCMEVTITMKRGRPLPLQVVWWCLVAEPVVVRRPPHQILVAEPV